jgi:hypothetical protein
VSETFLILRRIERNNIQMPSGLQVKYTLLLSEFNKTEIFSTIFRKIFKYHISLKPVLWKPSCSMRTEGRTDGQTDMAKLIITFRNIANASKNTKRQTFKYISYIQTIFWYFFVFRPYRIIMRLIS